MAIFDWNGDGKKDIWDTAIEYEVFNQIFGDENDEEEEDDEVSIDDWFDDDSPEMCPGNPGPDD